MVFHMGRAENGYKKMKDGEPQQDPDPCDMKNSRDEKCGEKQEKDVAERRKKKCGGEHDRQAQIKCPGFARLLAGERADGLEISPKRTEQAEQNVNQPARPGNRAAARNRASSMARRFQSRLAAEDDSEKESDPHGNAHGLQRILTDVILGLPLVSLGT